jgi:hypothetical protein
MTTLSRATGRAPFAIALLDRLEEVTSELLFARATRAEGSDKNANSRFQLRHCGSYAFGGVESLNFSIGHLAAVGVPPLSDHRSSGVDREFAIVLADRRRGRRSYPDGRAAVALLLRFRTQWKMLGT